MSNNNIKLVIFLILVFLLSYLSIKFYIYITIVYQNNNDDIKILGVSAIYTFIIIGLYYLASFNLLQEGYENVNNHIVKNEEYKYQHNSDNSIIRNSIYDTKKGKETIKF